MITTKAKEIIEWNPVALATVDKDWNPYCIVMAEAKVIWTDKVLITDNFMQKTKENILNNPKVALVCWNKEWTEDCVGFKFRWIADYYTSWEYYDKVKELNTEWLPAKWAIVITLDEIKEIG